MIEIVCAWCGRHMGSKANLTEGYEGITHSICERCLDKQMRGVVTAEKVVWGLLIFGILALVSSQAILYFTR